VVEILFAVLAFILLISAMAVGVLMGKKPIAGSCGGVAAALGEKDYTCEICGDDPYKCDESSSQANDPMYTDATQPKDKT
jgi:hypothetical protein